ncbi:hypothetical protein BpHYR1_005887 [Brachionus plicatilis]|uniref:Uncharacterized protein n=1 Tax=Brachionus plicatilis TaxID=10195 RepID=A0A3M7QLK7_BRAPC|nr:hypothetical protein BpHYR1_005887 [Brachionus plicatilis]
MTRKNFKLPNSSPPKYSEDTLKKALNQINEKKINLHQASTIWTSFNRIDVLKQLEEEENLKNQKKKRKKGNVKHQQLKRLKTSGLIKSSKPNGSHAKRVLTGLALNVYHQASNKYVSLNSNNKFQIKFTPVEKKNYHSYPIIGSTRNDVSKAKLHEKHVTLQLFKLNQILTVQPFSTIVTCRISRKSKLGGLEDFYLKKIRLPLRLDGQRRSFLVADFFNFKNSLKILKYYKTKKKILSCSKKCNNRIFKLQCFVLNCRTVSQIINASGFFRFSSYRKILPPSGRFNGLVSLSKF